MLLITAESKGEIEGLIVEKESKDSMLRQLDLAERADMFADKKSNSPKDSLQLKLLVRTLP